MIDDPWYDALASGWGEPAAAGAPAAPGARREQAAAPPDAPRSAADIYLEVHRSAAFQEVRRRYRRFVVPATAAFLLWYLGYLVAATAAPGLMSRPVAGAINVAMLAGLGQFLTTFLLTWAYVRHARRHRDQAALDLRWTVFDQGRAAAAGQRSETRPASHPAPETTTAPASVTPTPAPVAPTPGPGVPRPAPVALTPDPGVGTPVPVPPPAVPVSPPPAPVASRRASVPARPEPAARAAVEPAGPAPMATVREAGR